jgi:hypothetical protein
MGVPDKREGAVNTATKLAATASAHSLDLF